MATTDSYDHNMNPSSLTFHTNTYVPTMNNQYNCLLIVNIITYIQHTLCSMIVWLCQFQLGLDTNDPSVWGNILVHIVYTWQLHGPN